MRQQLEAAREPRIAALSIQIDGRASEHEQAEDDSDEAMFE